MILKDFQDAFGHGMYDYLNGTAGTEITERDDGLLTLSGGPELYFTPYKKWHPIERKAIRYSRGRVLDIGCGAGRHSLYLQEKGHDVVGIDNSPLAIEVCKKRGLKDARVISISQMSSRLGIFDTVIMFGNNFGLFGTPANGKRLLKRLYKMTAKKGRMIVGTRDPYDTDDPDHLSYQAANRAKSKMSGQMRIRVRYKRYASPWINVLLVSKKEMEDILEDTGWKVSKYIDENIGSSFAIIEKDRA